MTLNDINPKAIDLIRENAKLNGADVYIENRDANSLLLAESFDFIDLDPFGPPVRFLDCAFSSVRNNGVLAVTATDTSALCGTYPNACKRKYDAVPLRTDYYNESGLRLLIAFVARVGLRYGKGIEPFFSHCTRHYFRTYVRVRRGSQAVKNTMQSLGYLWHCYSSLRRGFSSSLDGLSTLPVGECQNLRLAGPMWAGEFSQASFCSSLKEELLNGEFNTKKEASKIAELVGLEQDVTLPYYDVHKLLRKLKKPARSMESIQEALREGGFNASRTHFSGTGIRTDAPIEFLESTISEED